MKTNYSLALLLFLFSFTINAQQTIHKTSNRQDILLIGTFHFHNPGVDAVKFKSLNIQAPEAQKEIEVLTDKIRNFAPDQIFVEWDYNDQGRLDSLYTLYLKDEYFAYVEKKYKGTKQYAFYSKNEIFQFAFRAARKAGLKKVYAIDYELDWPADTAFAAMSAAHQDSLIAEIQKLIQDIGAEYDYKMQRLTLTQLLLDLNTPLDRNKNAGFYIQYFNRAGSNDNFAGAFSVSEWYRRNLYLYSQVQKLTRPLDKKVMVLLGAGHVAMLEQFIKLDNQFTIVELQDLLRAHSKK